MKKILSFFLTHLLLIIPLNSFSQNQGQNRIDSLFTQLKNEISDTSKVIIYNLISGEFSNNKPDSAIYFANLACQIASKINYNTGIADAYFNIAKSERNRGNYNTALQKANASLALYNHELSSSESSSHFKIWKQKANVYNTIGLIYDELNRFNEAIRNYSTALVIKKTIGDKKGLINTYNNIGKIHYRNGQIQQALKNYSNALTICQETGDKQGMAYSYNNIGIVYRDQTDYKKALNNFLSSIKIKEETGDKQGIANSHSNIGVVYWLQGHYPEALKNHMASLKIKKEIGDKKGIAVSYNNIGLVYDDQGDYSEALKNYFFSAKIKLEIEDKHGLASTYNNIGGIYAKLKKNTEASLYFNKCLFLAEETGNLEDLKTGHYGLAKLDSTQGKFKQALEHYTLQIKYRDSLFNEDNIKKSVQSLMQFEFDKKDLLTKANQDKKDALSITEIQKQKLIRNYLIVIFILIVFSGVILFRQFNFKKKFEKQNAIIEERKRISRDMHDDLGSSLSKISMVSEVLKQQMRDPKEKANLEIISSSAQSALDKMSEIVWAMNPKNDTLGSLLAYIRKYAVAYFEPTAIDCKINIPHNINDIGLNGEQRRNIFLTVKEALYNVVKHSGATKVDISFLGNKGNWEITIHDNGKGIDIPTLGMRNDGTFGNGIENMKNRIEQAKGKLKIENSNGTLIRFGIYGA